MRTTRRNNTYMNPGNARIRKESGREPGAAGRAELPATPNDAPDPEQKDQPQADVEGGDGAVGETPEKEEDHDEAMSRSNPQRIRNFIVSSSDSRSRGSATDR
jgi:hypothetical protein